MLSHDPASWDSIKSLNRIFPLTLSGHTHGFQWGIYFAGIEFNLLKPMQKYWGGLYEQHDRFLYVNRGIGTIGMHLRVDMPAEITLITLKRSKIHR
jgi:predicted MPP superfamily phosphohydrolase